jgi:hypothetical protein
MTTRDGATGVDTRQFGATMPQLDCRSTRRRLSWSITFRRSKRQNHDRSLIIIFIYRCGMNLPGVVVVAAVDTFVRGLRFLTMPQLDYRSTVRRLSWSITFQRSKRQNHDRSLIVILLYRSGMGLPVVHSTEVFTGRPLPELRHRPTCVLPVRPCVGDETWHVPCGLPPALAASCPYS